jgi:hypothetical protein
MKDTATPAEFAKILTEHKISQGLRDPEQKPITRQYINKLANLNKVDYFMVGRKKHIKVTSSLAMLDATSDPIKAFSNRGKGGGRPPQKKTKPCNSKPKKPASDKKTPAIILEDMKSLAKRKLKAEADKAEAEAAIKIIDAELKSKGVVKFAEYNEELAAVLYPMFNLVAQSVLNLGTTISVKFPYPEYRKELKALIDEETRLILSGLSETTIDELIGV